MCSVLSEHVLSSKHFLIINSLLPFPCYSCPPPGEQIISSYRVNAQRLILFLQKTQGKWNRHCPRCKQLCWKWSWWWSPPVYPRGRESHSLWVWYCCGNCTAATTPWLTYTSAPPWCCRRSPRFQRRLENMMWVERWRSLWWRWRRWNISSTQTHTTPTPVWSTGFCAWRWKWCRPWMSRASSGYRVMWRGNRCALPVGEAWLETPHQHTQINKPMTRQRLRSDGGTLVHLAFVLCKWRKQNK